MKEIKILEKDIDWLSLREESFWRQRARVDWLKDGDRNTKFFHSRAKARNYNNYIHGFLSDNEVWLSQPEQMFAHTTDFFTTLFSSCKPSDSEISSVVDSIECYISQSDFEFLESPFTDEDVERALMGIGPNKAPGVDGFHAIFFQKHWSLLKKDVTSACLDVLNHGRSVKSINETIIVLIPKKKNPKRLSDFRPISLCSVLYKIISRTLAARLKKILAPLIAENQGAFVPGRLISDNAIMSFELLHSMSKIYSGKTGWMALKLDMSKAYDRVEWKLIGAILRKMGFPSRWCSLIHDCISTVQFTVSINGKLGGRVLPSRGLRQGCSLSPYLFILCAEVLSALLRRAELTGQIVGMRCTQHSPRISHLFFADDSIIFTKAKQQEANAILKLLSSYEKASGQVVNMEKTAITFSPNTQQATRQSILGIFRISSTTPHDTYLGLPSMIGRNKNRTFASIRERVWKRVSILNRNYLSAAGREVLIKAVVQAIPIYFMSLFRLPNSICKQLRSLVIRFWWGVKNERNKLPWVKWDTLCDSKFKGGLGFRDFELLTKQCWRNKCGVSSINPILWSPECSKPNIFLFMMCWMPRIKMDLLSSGKVFFGERLSKNGYPVACGQGR
ncbi:hypothetical protein DH2020_001254 [Rehmannia glutinosa]|uniref:Reverse transcriptase domain-containing protein n=1 Tax=Rehmannia glutinosa TaxID=99300 RepID=A0ABR0XZJ3_REHGL